MKRINVTKTFLPPLSEYEVYLQQIWESGQLTNQGTLLLEFEKRTEDYLKVKNFHFVSNGTIALQLALRSLDILDGEVITTPFSYVATTSAILWERCTPVYVDIEPKSFCIDANKIEAAITDKTRAILAVHVFGNPCNIEKIDAIGKKHNLKVIYDAAHAFGVKYQGKSLLSYGDISICSFHSTKPFHTIEGGCIITKHPGISKKIELLKRFGHTGDDHYMLGINAKASEFQAAMGLCNLKYIDKIISKRKEHAETYDNLLVATIQRPKPQEHTKYNHAYYPIVLSTEEHLLKLIKALEQEDIFARRYFYPSLNTLPYIIDSQSCPISEDISKRVACLPLYDSLDKSIISKICEVVNNEATA